MTLFRWAQGSGAPARLIALGTRFVRCSRAPLAVPPAVDRCAETASELPVLDYQSLIERTGSAQLVELLRVKMGFPREVFNSSVRPVIRRYAEYVQLLPALSPRRAAEELLLVRTLSVVSRALDYRRGVILPHGAPPEVIGAQFHRWTYAVFTAALLSELDACLKDSVVTIRCVDGSEKLWTPLEGSMQACGARLYRAECLRTTTADSGSPGALAQLMVDRIIPPSVLAWLTEEREPMRELRAFLAEEQVPGSSSIGQLVLQARTACGVLASCRREARTGRVTDGAAGPNRSRVESACEEDARDPCGRFDPREAQRPLPRPGTLSSPPSAAVRGGAAPTLTSLASDVTGAETSPPAGTEFLEDFEAPLRVSQFPRNRVPLAGP